MSQLSAHPLAWAQSKVQCPWALFRKTMGEQQFSNSLTVPHMLWSELDSGGTTGIGNQDQVTKLAVPHDAIQVGSCTTCVRLNLTKYHTEIDTKLN